LNGILTQTLTGERAGHLWCRSFCFPTPSYNHCWSLKYCFLLPTSASYVFLWSWKWKLT